MATMSAGQYERVRDEILDKPGSRTLEDQRRRLAESMRQDERCKRLQRLSGDPASMDVRDRLIELQAERLDLYDRTLANLNVGLADILPRAQRTTAMAKDINAGMRALAQTVRAIRVEAEQRERIRLAPAPAVVARMRADR